MPVHAGPLGDGAAVDTPETPEVVIRDVSRATWVAPDGTEVPLTTPSLGWKTLKRVKGLGAMPVTLNVDKLPRGGVNVRNVRREQRIIDWPLRIYGSTVTDFLANYHHIVDKFTQTDELGPGTLYIYRPDGSFRTIDAYYRDGLEGEPGTWRAESALITLLCETPWWLGPEAVSDSRVEVTTGDYLDPYPNVTSSKSLGATVIHNPGQLITYPTWTIEGPLSAITITNDDTGDAFTIDPNFGGGGNLLAGQTVTVVTDPMEITGPSDAVWTGAIDFPGAVLFGLARGDNNISISVTGATGDTSVSWSFRPRYRAA